MQIEHLYRGKGIDNGEWVEGTIHFNGKYILSNKYRNNYHEWVEIIPETVGQYTGMTDKNGTKIFEGDILLEKGKVNNGDTGAIDVESKRIVSIENASDGYMCVVSNYRSLVHHKTIEVIGNIHDNKDLIK